MKVTVVAPDHENLQFAAFWVAIHGGFFAKEGLEIEVISPDGPAATGNFFLAHGEADAAVMPPPIFLGLVAQKAPVVLGANLLKNDPINLVVRRSEAEARHVDGEMPLHDRLVALRGIKLGVAPHPPSRLRALYRAQGMDANTDLSLEIIRGKDQNTAFREHKVDALYAHTPYFERAVAHDDVVVIVNQSKGEVPELANRQIHGLVFRRGFLELKRPVAEQMVRAIAAAEKSFHESQATTVATLAKAFPDRDPKELEVFVRYYEPAIPDTPAVTAIDAPRWLALMPDNTPPPNLEGIDLSAYVALDLLPAPPPPALAPWKVAFLIVVAIAAFGTIASITWRRVVKM